MAHLDPHEPWNYRSVRRLTAPSLRANCPAPGPAGSSMGNLCWADSTVVLPVDGVDRYLHQPQLQPSDQAPPSVDYVRPLVVCFLPQKSESELGTEYSAGVVGGQRVLHALSAHGALGGLAVQPLRMRLDATLVEGLRTGSDGRRARDQP